MKLRKDDPLYYKLKINELLRQAQNEGLAIGCEETNGKVRISFTACNGDCCSVNLIKTK